MFYTGIADEAGKDLDTQIKAHQELGWTYIEPRMIGDACITDLSDEHFEAALIRLDAAGMKIAGFAAQIANWSRPIDGDFQVDVDELQRAIGRMQKAGTKFIRCMSYPNSKENPLSDEAWRDEVVRRFKQLAKMAADGGVVLMHENCHGWASESAENTLELIERVGSPALKLVFDTGNTTQTDSVAFYEKVREHVVHVHIKEGKPGPDGKRVACFPDEGDNGTDKVIADLLARGYDGGFSIEPHMLAVIHLGKGAEANPRAAYNLYVEYGQRLMKLVERVQAEANA